jgi:hypothetical protein
MYARFSFLLGLILVSQVASAGFLKSAEERLKEDAEKFPDKALLAEFYPKDESLQRYKLEISGEALLLSQGEYGGYKSNEDVVQKYRQTDYTQDAVATHSGAGQWRTTAAGTLARSGRGSRSVLRGYGHRSVGGAARYPFSLNSPFNAAFTHSKPKCSCSSRRFLRMRLSRSSSNNARSVSVSRGRSRTT